ncbi:MAG: DUF2147 domain-containing protein [Alphaproteobacteria bacterium]|nr:DUF2147 domain-containing protein [Alphaproteobacteria bacterium]
MILALALFAAAPAAHPPLPPDASINGTWWNSDGGVSVDVQPCGAFICGAVTHAGPKAEQDARKGGFKEMVGLRVMRDFQHVGPGKWKGTVLVPERAAIVRSTITRIDAGHMKVEGCILGFICSHEIWRRVR